MEDEEAVTSVRRTRSGKLVQTPSVKAAKTAKPASRKTRKKVVLMEVEVSDDEDELQTDNGTKDHSDQESEERKTEEELLAFPEESDDARDTKKNAGLDDSDKADMNGSNNIEEVVFNDVDMIQAVDDDIQDKKTEEKMEVDEVSAIEKETISEVSEVLNKKELHDEKGKKTEVIETKVNQKSADKEKAEEKTEETENVKEQVKTSNEVAKTQITNVQTDKEESKGLQRKIETEQKTDELAADIVGLKNVEKSPEKKKEDEKEIEKTEEVSKEKEESAKSDEKIPESIEKTIKDEEQKGDPDTENISEDELPGVPVVKVPEAEEVSDEELPGPKRAELPADTEVVSEDELPTENKKEEAKRAELPADTEVVSEDELPTENKKKDAKRAELPADTEVVSEDELPTDSKKAGAKPEEKKESVKRKIDETDYDPGSPTSESEAPSKKPSLEIPTEKEEKAKPKKLPELDKYWKAVNDDPTDFTGWTYLLQYVDQESDMEAAREAYDAFLSHYPYCYGYWRKYADYEKRKGNKKKCEEVFERGLKAIPLSVDLWIHYLTYVKTSRPDDEEYVRSQFERALTACGLEFRSDRLWDSYIKWETEGKRLQKVTAIYDRLLATPTQGYTTHFDNFQEHITSNPPNKVVEVDEFLALRKEVRHMLKHDTPTEGADNSDAPPGDEDQSKVISSDEETKSIRERIVSIRRKIHKSTVNAVTARWNYEEGIKRPYFHVKPLERCQLKNWQDYLDYETEQGDKVRIIVLFERCLIACALYEEFWLKFVHYLESLKDPELQSKIRDVYERACTIHHLKKPNLHLQWAMFEEGVENINRAAEILVNLEKSVPNILQIAYRRINLERRRADFEKCSQLYEHYISNSKNKMISSNIAIKYSRFCLKVQKNLSKAQEVLKSAITKDPNNPRLYLQLVDLTLHKDDVTESEIIEIMDSFLDKDSTDIDQKVLFAQRKLEYLEDFGSDIQMVQLAHDVYQKLIKQSKDTSKKKEIKSESASSAKKEKSATQPSSQTSSYGNYGGYGPSSNQPPYPYSASQQGQYNYSQYGQGDQYQYQNWQYPQGGYGGYNQWGGYGGGYGY